MTASTGATINPVITIACHRCRAMRERIALLEQQLDSAERQTDAVLSSTAHAARVALQQPDKRVQVLALIAAAAEEAIERRQGR